MYNHTMNLHYIIKRKHNQVAHLLFMPCPCRNRRPGDVENGLDNKEIFKVGQPCPLLSSQIHKISLSAPPWTADQIELPNARLCSHHHSNRISDPPSWGQGTEQWQHCHPQHTSERHCGHSAHVETNRNKTNTLSTVYMCRAGHSIQIYSNAVNWKDWQALCDNVQ